MAATVRASTAPTATLSPTSPASTAIGDLVLVITWTRGGAGIPTHTLQSGDGFFEIRTHDHNDGSTDGRLSVAYKVATSAGANTYQAYTSSAGSGNYSAIVVLQVGTWEHSSIGDVSNSATLTTNGLPNPPSIVTPQAQCLVLVIGAWHLGSAADVAITAPTNYTEVFEAAGTVDYELSVAQRTVATATTEDPGTFGDNVAPNGSVAMTIAFRPRRVTLGCDTSAVSASGISAGVRAQRALVAAAAALALTATDATLTYTPAGNDPLVADATDYAVTSESAGLRRGYSLVSSNASLVLDAVATTLRASRRLTGDAAAHTVAAQDSALRRGRDLDADAASFGLTAQAAGLRAARNLEADVSAHALSAHDAGLRRTFYVGLATASILWSASDTGLRAARLLAGAVGTFTVSAGDALLPRAVRLPATALVVATTAVAAELHASRQLTMASASVAALAHDAALARTVVCVGAVAAFSWSGHDVAPRRAMRLVAIPLEVTADGLDMGMLRREALACASCEHAVSVEDAGLRRVHLFVLDANAFGADAQDADLDYSGADYVLNLDAGISAVEAGAVAGRRALRIVLDGQHCAYEAHGALFGGGLTIAMAPAVYAWAGQALAFVRSAIIEAIVRVTAAAFTRIEVSSAPRARTIIVAEPTARIVVMADSRAYYVGDDARLTARFRVGSAGTLTDPSALDVVVTRPDGTKTTYVYGVSAQLVRSAQGIYVLTVDCTQAGSWTALFRGTGAAKGTAPFYWTVRQVPS